MAALALASLGGNAFALARVAARALEERTVATDAAAPPRTAPSLAAPAPVSQPILVATVDPMPPEAPPRAPVVEPARRPSSATPKALAVAPREPEVPVSVAPSAEPAVAKLDLMEAMRLAAGPSAASRPTPAPVFSRVEPDAKQLHPAPGALVAAIANVQDGARRCLEPGDAPRACTVVFRSGGDVARVDVPGGDAKSECIRASLARARLDAFSEPSYPARILVRP